MAKITITIEDIFDDKVKIVCEPNFMTMMSIHVSGNQLKASHGYAICALNAIRDESKKRGPQNIIIPRLKP